MSEDHYGPIIDALRSSGIRAEFHRPHQLALPQRVWISWAEQDHRDTTHKLEVEHKQHVVHTRGGQVKEASQDRRAALNSLP